MLRRIIAIDEGKCNGCGICASACRESAIDMVDGKAHLMRDDYCDGLGDCMPSCPTGALSFVMRETQGYDMVAALANRARKAQFSSLATAKGKKNAPSPRKVHHQWPVQIKLVPVNAPYFDGAHLLIAADCVAYAYANFHDEYMQGKVTLIGCPKLDEGDYSEKLSAILAQNEVQSVTVARMEVPCCAAIERAIIVALRDCGKAIPWQVVIISTDGEALS